MNGKLHVRILGGLAGFFLAAACGSEPKPPPRAADAPPPPVAAAAPAPATVPPEKRATAASSIVVSQDIRNECGIADPKTYFAYDSARLRQKDQSGLKQLARCVTQGPLRQRRLQLVGHADPRGSERYNYQLGQSRANSVKVALRGMGVAAGQLSTSSRGKLDARGANEAGWALDRRVEVSLAD